MIPSKPIALKKGENVDIFRENIMDMIFNVLDNMDNYFLWLEKDATQGYICRFANQPFLDRVGYQPADIFNRPLSQFIKDRNQTNLMAMLDAAESKNYDKSKIHNPFSLSFKKMGRDNQWTELACYATYCQIMGNRDLFLGCTEIDPRYRVAFRNSQLYEEALDGIFTLHTSGEIKNGNKRIKNLVGSRKGHLTVDLFKKFMPERQAEGLVKYLRHRLKGEMENYPFYINIKSLDGKEKYYSVRTISNPVTESEIIVYIRDVSDVKRLENNLKESENKYRSVVEHSRDIIFLAKPDQFIMANRIGYELIGEKLRNPNLHWKEYAVNVVDEDRERTVNFMLACFDDMAKGEDISNRSIEFKLKNKTGEILHMDMILSQITYYGENILLGTVRDITERKKLEVKTTESIRMGTLAQFAASVAHEIRNPLEALTSAGLLLSRGLELEGENKQLLEAMNNATADINTVVRQFVSMTTVPEYHFSETNVKKMLQSVIKTVKGLQSFNPQVEIKVSVQRGMPDLQCDIAQLHTTLCNIINNSCNAITGKGNIRIRAEQKEHNAQNALQITIRDTGDGIAPDVIGHIWEPFFTSKKKGMGLGLFIAKHCIEAHNGYIHIPFSDKRGTMVQILLPILQKAR